MRDDDPRLELERSLDLEVAGRDSSFDVPGLDSSFSLSECRESWLLSVFAVSGLESSPLTEVLGLESSLSDLPVPGRVPLDLAVSGREE